MKRELYRMSITKECHDYDKDEHSCETKYTCVHEMPEFNGKYDEQDYERYVLFHFANELERKAKEC